jgi:hypothetical protein
VACSFDQSFSNNLAKLIARQYKQQLKMAAFANAAALTAECERSGTFNFTEQILNSVPFL